jgi:hypothetical protein
LFRCGCRAAAGGNTFRIGRTTHALLELEGVDFNKPLAKLVKEQLPAAVGVNALKLRQSLLAVKPEPKLADGTEKLVKLNALVSAGINGVEEFERAIEVYHVDQKSLEFSTLHPVITISIFRRRPDECSAERGFVVKQRKILHDPFVQLSKGDDSVAVEVKRPPLSVQLRFVIDECHEFGLHFKEPGGL